MYMGSLILNTETKYYYTFESRVETMIIATHIYTYAGSLKLFGRM